MLLATSDGRPQPGAGRPNELVIYVGYGPAAQEGTNPEKHWGNQTTPVPPIIHRVTCGSSCSPGRAWYAGKARRTGIVKYP